MLREGRKEPREKVWMEFMGRKLAATYMLRGQEEELFKTQIRG